MGSFYGQVLYEFTKLFYKIKVNNNLNQSVSNEDISETQEAIVPSGDWDELKLNSGNYWIQLETDPEQKSITITHTAPGNTDETKSVIGFTNIDDLPDGAEVIELNPGAYIRTTKSEYDTAGHSKGAENMYFKLPFTDVDESAARIDNIEKVHLTIADNDTTDYDIEDQNKGINITDFLEKNRYVTDENLNEVIADYLNENNYSTNHIYDQQYDMGEKDNYGNPIMRYPYLSETIGQIDGENGYSKSIAGLVGVNGKDRYSISESLGVISEKIDGLEDDNNGVSARLTLLINRLKELNILDPETNNDIK